MVIKVRKKQENKQERKLKRNRPPQLSLINLESNYSAIHFSNSLIVNINMHFRRYIVRNLGRFQLEGMRQKSQIIQGNRGLALWIKAPAPIAPTKFRILVGALYFQCPGCQVKQAKKKKKTERKKMEMDFSLITMSIWND